MLTVQPEVNNALFNPFAKREIGIAADTDVLTRRGWIKIEDTKEDDRFLVLDPKWMSINYVDILHFTKVPYKGDMLHFNTPRMDAVMTGNVPLMAWNRQSKNGIVQLKKARCSENLNKRNRAPYKTFSYLDGDSLDSDYICIPEVKAYNKHVKTIVSAPSLYVRYNVWLEFLGFWLSNVRYKEKPNDNSILLMISDEGEREYVIDLFKKIGIDLFTDPNTYMRSSSTKHVVYSKQICSYLSDNFAFIGEKRIPRWIMNLNKALLSSVLRGILIGSGYIIQYNETKHRITFTSTSLNYLNDLAEIVLKVYGVIPKILTVNREEVNHKKKDYTYYRIGVSIDNTDRFMTYGTPTVEPYEGQICHLYFNSRRPLYYLAKRENKSFWIGGATLEDFYGNQL